jgi:inner membrane protein
MPSFFGHAVASVALGKAFSSEKQSLNFWLLAAYCSVIPDGDVIAFYLGIPYNHILGHRGFSHSILFALLLGFFVVSLFYRDIPRFSSRWWRYASFFFIVTLSHSLLDALTNGGFGVALFAPFSNERFFFPWRPLEVAPIGGLTHFLRYDGWLVIRSELMWIWIPSLFLFLASTLGRKYFVRASDFKEGRRP